MEIIKMIYWILIVGIGCGLIVIAFLFLMAVIITFFKVFFKSVKRKSYKVDPSYCSHENSRYTESHPDLVWTCNDCGKLH